MGEYGEFAREIQALALHGVEQTRAYNELAKGDRVGDTAEGIELLAALVANQGRIAFRIAQEIDELRSRLDAANL